jgi:hypothetical protein
MPRAFLKGIISFGLVAIPVKMYVGMDSKTLNFHLLHKKCLTRPRQVLYCETDDEYFGVKETVRGYEVAKEQYVVLNEGDFEQEKLTGKVFVDYSQNVRGKTLASVYSPRPTPDATISTPLRLEELGKVLYPTDFTLITLPERLKETGNLWAGILSAKQDLNRISRIK